MLNEVFQSTWFWPLTILSLVGYYGWVLYHYFRGAIKNPFKGNWMPKTIPGKSISLNWDELVLGFELHRRLISNPLAELSQDERSLLGKFPFRELILKTTSK